MATQLRMIRRGEHPVSKAKLGPPTTLHHLNGEASGGHQRSSEGSEPKSQPCIDNDGTAFSDAFRRRGIPQATASNTTTMLERVRMKVVADLLEHSGNGAEVRSFLSPAELMDPELVDFWSSTAP